LGREGDIMVMIMRDEKDMEKSEREEGEREVGKRDEIERTM
jgi:hypothetical protein